MSSQLAPVSDKYQHRCTEASPTPSAHLGEVVVFVVVAVVAEDRIAGVDVFTVAFAVVVVVVIVVAVATVLAVVLVATFAVVVDFVVVVMAGVVDVAVVAGNAVEVVR